MTHCIHRRRFAGAILVGALMPAVPPAFAAGQGVPLFSFVSENSTVVAALTREDVALGSDAAAVGKALRERGALTVWRYAVRKAKDGELEQAPLAKISLQAQGVQRVEPYRTPLRVVPVE